MEYFVAIRTHEVIVLRFADSVPDEIMWRAVSYAAKKDKLTYSAVAECNPLATLAERVQKIRKAFPNWGRVVLDHMDVMRVMDGPVPEPELAELPKEAADQAIAAAKIANSFADKAERYAEKGEVPETYNCTQKAHEWHELAMRVLRLPKATTREAMQAVAVAGSAVGRAESAVDAAKLNALLLESKKAEA